MYGHWVKPDRFLNFRDLYQVYFTSLRNLAYRFDDILGSRIERLHSAGVDGYLIEGRTAEEVAAYFATYQLPTAKFKYQVATADATIEEKLVAGSVLITFDKIDSILADDGHGILRVVDGTRAGTVDYATGKVSITNPVIKARITDDGVKFDVGYAVTTADTKAAALTDTVTGLASDATAKALAAGLIPGTQVGFTASIYTISDSRKFFVGFTTDDKDKIGKILSAIAEKPVTVKAKAAEPSNPSDDQTEEQV